MVNLQLSVSIPSTDNGPLTQVFKEGAMIPL